MSVYRLVANPSLSWGHGEMYFTTRESLFSLEGWGRGKGGLLPGWLATFWVTGGEITLLCPETALVLDTYYFVPLTT